MEWTRGGVKSVEQSVKGEGSSRAREIIFTNPPAFKRTRFSGHVTCEVFSRAPKGEELPLTPILGIRCDWSIMRGGSSSPKARVAFPWRRSREIEGLRRTPGGEGGRPACGDFHMPIAPLVCPLSFMVVAGAAPGRTLGSEPATLSALRRSASPTLASAGF